MSLILESPQQWSVCLQSRQEGRKIVTVSSKASTSDLYDLASQVFGKEVCLKYGFPPKPLLNNEQLSIDECISNQERLQVEVVSNFNDTVMNKTKQTTTTLSSSSARRPKRAAAVAATQAMPAVIQAQDELMKSSATSPKKRSRTSATHNKKIKKTATKFTGSGIGYRLSDGVAVGNSRRRKQKNILEKAPPGSDMSQALLGALNDKGKMGRVLRNGMKNAVAKSYETTRAFSRLAAIQANTYEILDEKEDVLTIQYRGSVDKKMQNETVDKIPIDVLRKVITSIHESNQEALRAENLALFSPRVLWSLVVAFPSLTKLNDIYASLLPSLEWAFLRRRAQQLSEKAMENLRQEQETAGNNKREDMEQAQEAITAVEDAMEHLHDRTERASRQAQAALARLTATATDWKLITPNESDRDELRDCIQMALPISSIMTMDACIDKLFECGIHNWRELANASEETLTKHVLEKANTIQSWMDKAQQESVDEIMVETCDNSINAVEVLTQHARTGTPKDLANWRLIPEVLHSHLPSSCEISIQQLTTWSQRAYGLLQEYEWLQWYATPVE
jgi:hypothetical protein